ERVSSRAAQRGSDGRTCDAPERGGLTASSSPPTEHSPPEVMFPTGLPRRCGRGARIAKFWPRPTSRQALLQRSTFGERGPTRRVVSTNNVRRLLTARPAFIYYSARRTAPRLLTHLSTLPPTSRQNASTFPTRSL